MIKTKAVNKSRSLANSTIKALEKITLVLLVCTSGNLSLSAQNNHLCEAVKKNDFKKVERIVNVDFLENKYGHRIHNGKAISTNYDIVYDDLTASLARIKCVELAAWNKSQIKIPGDPGYVTTVAISKTQNPCVEKTFHIHPRKANKKKQWYRSRERIYYIGLKDGNELLGPQLSPSNIKSNKRALDKAKPNPNTLTHDYIISPLIQSYSDTIEYKSLLGRYVCIDANINDTITMSENGDPAVSVVMTRSAKKNETYSFRIIAAGRITQIGSYSPWHIQIAGIRKLDDEKLEVQFSSSYDFVESATIKLTYRKIKE